MKDIHENRDVLVGSAYPHTDRLARIERMLRQVIATVAEIDDRVKRYTATQDVFDKEFRCAEKCGTKEKCTCGWSAEDLP